VTVSGNVKLITVPLTSEARELCPLEDFLPPTSDRGAVRTDSPFVKIWWLIQIIKEFPALFQTVITAAHSDWVASYASLNQLTPSHSILRPVLVSSSLLRSSLCVQ
jgi:hypothetical protein